MDLLKETIALKEEYAGSDDAARRPKWRKPSQDELKLEYKLEYSFKNGDSWTKGAWPTEAAFLASANAAQLKDITPAMDDRMRYRSHTKSRESLVSLLKSYRSWPEFRNMKTVERLYNGIQDGSTLPAPIVLDFGGKLRIFGGNTRADAFRQIWKGESYKALVIKVPGF